MPELTIICVSYQRYQHIYVLLHCFLAQTLQNFRLIVLHDGPDPQMESILTSFKNAHPEKIDFYFSEERYNDYGHSLREKGIELAQSEYLLITNDDNYYCPKFLELMFEAIHLQKADIALCDMIHSHDTPGGRDQGPYRYFETAPMRYSIDMGCFITKTALAKKSGFRDKTHDGDATFFEDILEIAENPVIAKLNQALFYHN